MSARRPFSDIPDSSVLRLAQSLRAQMPVTRTLARTRRATALFALFLGLVLPIAAASRFMSASRSDIPRSPEMQMKSMAAVALATSGLITNIAAGDAVEWRVADGGNGHWYEGVAVAADISWDAAKVACESRGGHLATLTSPAEDDFLWALASHPTIGSW